MKPKTEYTIVVARLILILSVLAASLALLPDRGTAQVPSPASQDCDTVIKQISDDLEQFTTAAELVGRVRQRINDGEVAAQTPEEEKAAQEADLAILEDKKHEPGIVEVGILSLWDKFTRDLPCAKSRPKLGPLLDELEHLSEKIGKEQEMLDRRTGKVDQGSIDKDRDEVKRIKGEIKDLFASCCAEEQVSQNPRVTKEKNSVFMNKPLNLWI